MAIDHTLSAGWLKETRLQAVFSALGSHNCRLVGGCVRDGLLGLAVSDIDFATTLLPDRVMERAQIAGFKAVPTGIDHGTVTLVLGGDSFEITTLREDVETDGRRAVVAFSAGWETDAARRDFTINALYADCGGAVSDYFGGLDDLSQRRVRFIGDANTRIKEDALRILRFYRFSARFAERLDDEGRAACKAGAAMIQSLSRERIASEWVKILGHADPAHAIAAMQDDGVIAAFLPEATPEPLADLLHRERALGVEPDYLRRFVAMLPRDQACVTAIARRLKLSNAVRKAMVDRVAATCADESPDALFYRYGVEAGRDGLLITGRPGGELAAEWQRPTFPVRAGDIQAVSDLSGKALGKALHTLEDAWIESGFSLSKEDLLKTL